MGTSRRKLTVFVDIEAGAQPWEADGERSDGGELVLAGEDWLSCR